MEGDSLSKWRGADLYCQIFQEKALTFDFPQPHMGDYVHFFGATLKTCKFTENANKIFTNICEDYFHFFHFEASIGDIYHAR